ncbi:MAG: NAD-dependent deacylase [Desulfobacterales bacterium]
MVSSYQDAAELLLTLESCVALTGAGISAESGIPTFRSKDGLWEKYDPMVYASIEVFRRDPSKYWQIRGEFIRNYDTYVPNAAHHALVELEQMGLVRRVITQNIDGLHKKAGSREVIELHGSLREIICQRCGKRYLAPHIPVGTPPACACGGVLKPDTVLFGEPLPKNALEAAYRESQTCRAMLVIGTSAVVYPAAHLPVAAKQNGAKVIEINVEHAFAAADIVLLDKAAAAMARLLDAIKELSGDFGRVAARRRPQMP